MTEPNNDDQAVDETAANAGPEPDQVGETNPPEPDQADGAEGVRTRTPDDDEEMFPRAYVEKLRKENATYRDRAKSSEDLATRLHTELVRATGRLADPSDLPFDPDHLDDPGKLTAAIDDLLTAKPHLGSRKPSGDIGQGPAKSSGSVDLAALLRSRAG